MTLDEFKLKTLRMIEEAKPDAKEKTDDPDIAAKFNDITNQVMFELARIKKIAKYVEITVSKGERLTFEDIEKAAGYDIYQVAMITGVKTEAKANGTVYKILESGTAEIDCYVYPERITYKTSGSYEFELSQDALEIMPYGVAADLLKSDVSTNYGSIYASRYEQMLQRLDPRNAMPGISIEGGVDF